MPRNTLREKARRVGRFMIVSLMFPIAAVKIWIDLGFPLRPSALSQMFRDLFDTARNLVLHGITDA